MRPLLLLALLPAALLAQAPARRHVDADHAWLQLFHEQRLGKGWSLFADAQFRRADIPGERPQQLLLRPGLLYAVTPGLGVGGGYAYVATADYNVFNPLPFPEHRIWQQLTLSSTTGKVRWNHRFRAEQRWLGRPLAGGGVSEWVFRQRFRPLTRASVDLSALGIPAKRLYLTAWDELFIIAGETANGQIFDHNRLAFQLGVRLSPKLRVEAGYMQQLFERGAARNTEDNHTLLVSVFSTGGR